MLTGGGEKSLQALWIIQKRREDTTMIFRLAELFCETGGLRWVMPCGGSADFRLLNVVDNAGIGCGKEVVGELRG